MPSDNERTDQLLRGAARVVEPPTPAELDRVWNRVSATMSDAPAGASARRGGAWLAAAAAGVLVAAGAGVASADLFSAETGRQVPPDEVNLAGPGELLVPAAPDFDRVLERRTRDIPFPDRSSRIVALNIQTADMKADGGNVEVSDGALRGWVAKQAVCAWTNTWAGALASGDATTRDRAVDTLAGAHAWPAVMAVDPDQTIETDQVTELHRDGTVGATQTLSEGTLFWHLQPLLARVRAGDTAGAADVLAEENVYCTPDLVPHIPMADSRTNWAAKHPDEAARQAALIQKRTGKRAPWVTGP